ncbi:class I SAM-dependent methyltransferase [Nocardiopsis sediminis]|uniref:Class I SAM-dependent methyltransferase n=1 Tax=Nocardiopsis sediminis TaxID=1778267 RepID=A0ABV8FQG7_9ACTN
MSPDDPKELVRRGYNAVSHRYRADDDRPDTHVEWAATLADRLPAGGRVVDLGCGNGVPVARDLCAQGFAVTGVDASEVQVARARPHRRSRPHPTPSRPARCRHPRCGRAATAQARVPPVTAATARGPR